MMMWWRSKSSFSHLIVGLGNPGKNYAGTLHNAGFRVVDNLASRLEAPQGRNRGSYFYTEARYEGNKVVLLQPLTFMNRSGEAVRSVMKWYRLEPFQLVVVYDDMDLPIGALRLRPRGGSGGHRGLTSIIDNLKTDDFPRLRVGIGKPPEGMSGPSYVLSKPHEDNAVSLAEAEKKAAEAALVTIDQGIDEAMNKFNAT